MYNVLNDDKIVQCPYNKYHTVCSSKFQRHLVKCEKKYGANYKIVCPYNATHRLSKSEIAEHIKTCPTRKVIEASHAEQYTIPAPAKQSDEFNFASTVENSWEEQISTYKSATNFAYVNRNDESDTDDTESFISSVGIGRGRIRFGDGNIPMKLQFLKKSYNF